MRSVGIIDYGLCNIDSITRAVAINGGRATPTRDPDVVREQDLLVLPGVGSFGAAMHNLREWGLVDAIHDQVGKGTPLFGICLGMQLLGRGSEENGSSEGLGLVDGDVVRLKPATNQERVPHIGWNQVALAQPDPVTEGVGEGTDFYFVHSFHMRCSDASHVVGLTPFCGELVSIVRNGCVFGTQFHPEKSWPAGHLLLRNFIANS